MKNFQQNGEVLTLVAPSGGVVSGGVYKIGSFIVVAVADKAVDEEFEGQRRGVFSVTKVGSQAWTQGAPVYWDNGNTRFTTTSGGNTLAGAAVEAVGSGSGETTGVVLLDGTVR